MRVRWAAADPDALARYLGNTLGLAVDALDHEPAVLFPGGTIVLAFGGEHAAAPGRNQAAAPDGTPAPAPGGRLRLELESLDEPPTRVRTTQPGGLVDLVGVGWATVELDRAVREFAPRRFEAVAPDASLGAHALVGRVGAGSLVLLEPSTEGRLAAALARFGEGATAVYLAARPGALEPLAERSRKAGEQGRIASGPFGRSFVVDASAQGPYLVVCEGSLPATRSDLL